MYVSVPQKYLKDPVSLGELRDTIPFSRSRPAAQGYMGFRDWSKSIGVVGRSSEGWSSVFEPLVRGE